MPTTTQAYVARQDSLKLETVHYPDLAADEVLVDIVAASICHSDVKAAQGIFHLKPPLIIGHEGAGYVKEVGSSVSYVKPGDAVILAFASCGECRRCQTGREPYCERMFELNFLGKRLNGTPVVKDENRKTVSGLFFGQSSISRVALAKENSCVKVECSKDELKSFASLGCGVQTGAGAILNVTKPAEDSYIAIFGGGAVGLSAVLAAKMTNPACVVLVDNSEAKLAMIPKELTEGVHVLNSSKLSPDDLTAELKKLTPNGRGMDVVVDGVGNETVANVAYASLDKLGTVVIVGGSPTAKPHYAIERSLVNGLSIRGTHQGDSVPRVMIPKLIDLWRDGKFPFDRLLTRFKFEDLQKALDETHAGHVIKPLLEVQ